MKKLIFSLLMTSIIFTVGCENAAESTENTLASSSEMEESITDVIDIIPGIEYDYSIYERFTPAEIDNMDFCQKGLFSYTTDYVSWSPLTSLSVGDTLEVEFKLTNMTNIPMNIATLTPPRAFFESSLVNPVANNAEEIRFAFEPYETKTFNLEVEVTDDSVIEFDTYNLCSSTVFSIYDPPLYLESEMGAFYILRVDNLRVSVKKEE